MGKIKSIWFAILPIILLSGYVISASVDGLEKRVDQDSYIDALHKTHAEDSLNALNCECSSIFGISFFHWRN